ncbi:hypothetical protein M5D96_008422 [Drosophila gunungcola]|uniref:arginyltransferase n=1 Tax=Drosophila gunungcola TaxID=103775 RepID=A0A9Q0BN22_9MUSC|nr:hypothetical protein M5D96_008422 [Drosophila gunungcola]
MSVSIVQYYGSQEGKCGYCGGTNCSLSHGMHAYRLDCQDYQDLIDRGWRRCGNYCYKLRNQETCCPCYTIKCDGLEFKLSNGTPSRRAATGRAIWVTVAGEAASSEPQPQLPDKSPAVINVDQVASLARAQKKPSAKQAAVSTAEAPTLGSNKSAAPISNAPRKKAKQMRLERRQAKLGDTASTSTKSVCQEKSLRDFLSTDSETNKHQLKIVLVASSDTQRTCADAVIALYRKYQITIHNDNPARLTLASMQRFLVKSPLKLRLVHVHDEEFNRTLPESFALYKKYQISIHNDPPKNQNAYKDHLQLTPMKNEKPSDGPEMGYGSFHQQYWLDDKLIAVGVIDILPACVSSVYFFYDPDYSFLSLGTYGSLREIDLVQSIAENVPALKYYYMGFYIHSCPKMRYKGKLSASYLLCPETYEWLPLTDVYVPKRVNLAIMLFMACLLSYMMRVNLSINIIAMVEDTSSHENGTEVEVLPNYGPRYNWTQSDQALLLGAYFYGYMITSLPAGTLAEMLGARNVAGYSCLVAGILTALTPAAAAWDKYAVFVVRFLIGFLNGVVLVSKWAPPDEKGKFVASLMGGTFGTVITWPLSGVIIENMGWDWAFYMVGIFVLVVVAIWFYLKWPPYKELILSLPFWSLMMLHYGSMWGLFFLITATPKFLSEVLGFNLSSAGFLSSLPHVARLLCAFGFGAVADWIPHILPGVMLIILAYFGRDPYVCVAIMTISLGFNGAATASNLANSQDLAPNYAGTLYGIINCVGTTPGIFSPLIVAAFTKNENTIDQWHWIFIIGAAAYILPALFFWVFGSGKIQKWNEVQTTESREDIVNTKL